MTTKQREVLDDAIRDLGIGDVYRWEHLDGSCRPSRRGWLVRFVNEHNDILSVTAHGADLDFARKG